jgi:hypothetical protein
MAFAQFGPFTTSEKETWWLWVPGATPGTVVAMGMAYSYGSNVTTHDHGNYMDRVGVGPNEHQRHYVSVRNNNHPNSSTFIVIFKSV